MVLFLQDDGNVELGYAVGPAHCGQDLAARSLRIFTVYALELGLRPLRLKIEAHNAASESVARRTGHAVTDRESGMKVEKGLEITLLTCEYRSAQGRTPRRG